MRVWFGIVVDREFHDGIVHPSPQWAAMARDSLTARGYQLTDDDPVIHWDEITDQVAAMSASGMKAGDYWLRIGFTEVPGDVVAEEGIG